MAEVTDKPATYADIEALPPNVVGEILYGQLVTHPRPSPAHAFASSSLGGELVGPFQRGLGGPGGWYILDEPEIHLGDHVVVPEMTGWKKERMSRLPDTAAFHMRPDWVCEFLSPSTQRHDKGDKRDIYAEFGVPYLWFVNPIQQILKVFRLKGRDWIAGPTYFADDPVQAPPFDAVTFSLGHLWDSPETPDKTPSPSN